MAFLSKGKIFSAVVKAMKSGYVEFTDPLCRSHVIKEYKSWKAAELKTFIIFISVPALQDILQKQAMDSLWK